MSTRAAFPCAPFLCLFVNIYWCRFYQKSYQIDPCFWNVLPLGLFCCLFMLVHSPPLPLSCLPFPTSLPHLPCCPISLVSRPALANHTASKPGGGVKKVTGVGGTTYEISVWAANLLRGVLPGAFRVTGLVLPNRTSEPEQSRAPETKRRLCCSHRTQGCVLQSSRIFDWKGTMAYFLDCIMAGYRHVYQTWFTALLWVL